MNNVDNEFLARAHYDIQEESQAVSTTVASLETRQIISKTLNETEMYTTIDIPEQFRIDAKPFINRPFYVGEMTFDTASVVPRHHLIKCSFPQLPGDLIRSNTTLLNGLKMGSYYRSKCKLNISMAGTITHAGCVLVGIIPPLPYALDYSINQSTLINTILTGPHAFLNANEATSVTLPVPWYCNSDLATLDMDTSLGYTPSCDISVVNGNYATLIALSLNPLQPSEGSNTALQIIVEAIFENLDILVPTPRYVKWVSQSFFKDLGTGLLNSASAAAKSISGDAIDQMRKAVSKWTGLHNPSTASLTTANLVVNSNRQNNIDSTQYFETLDPHSHLLMTLETPAFNTSTDEMDMSHIISKKQYLGTFRVNVSDQVGQLVFCRPISPYQGGGSCLNSVLPTNSISNNIELMHLLSRAWKGSIKITIQSVMNNKQQVKLRLLQMYNPSISAASAQPIYRDILQAPSHLMEFTAGGQNQEIVLPCLSRNSLIPCARDSSAEGLFHGMYYIYVAQPLANSGGSPTDIYFNVYINLEKDFSFYGYSTELSLTKGVAVVVPPPPPRIFKAEVLDVMNEPQDQNDKVNTSVTVDTDTTRMAPILHMRDFIRRMYNINNAVGTFGIAPNGVETVTLRISNFFNEVTEAVAAPPVTNVSKTIASMYYGKFGGLKVRVTISNESTTLNNIQLSIGYIPPNVFVSAIGGLVKPCLVNPSTYQPDNVTAYPIPVNFKSVPNYTAVGVSSYEFTVPYTSFFKYVGGPNKLVFNLPSYYTRTSTDDMGSLVLQYFNPSSADVKVYTQFQIGHTDESRLGFHSIAPYIERPVENEYLVTPYLGSFGATTAAPVSAPNQWMYRTRV